MAEKKKEAKQVPVRLATAEEKKKALDAAIAHIEKTYGKGAVMKLGKAPDYNVDLYTWRCGLSPTMLWRNAVKNHGECGITESQRNGITDCL